MGMGRSPTQLAGNALEMPLDVALAGHAGEVQKNPSGTAAGKLEGHGIRWLGVGTADKG